MNYFDRAGASSAGGLLAGNPSMQQNVVSAPVERKPSQMEQAMKELEGQHARLDALVGELERRISPVLFPAPPSQVGDQANQATSPLSGKLFAEAATVRSIAERMDSIIARVDL